MRLPVAVEQIDLSAVNLYDPAWYATGDPHSAWYTLRSESPVYWQELPDQRGFWVVTRHRDVCAVLRKFSLFTSRSGNLLTTLSRKDLASDKMLAVTDPPLHTIIKRQLNRFFTRSAIERLRPAIRGLARRVIAGGASGTEFDLATHTAMYPVAVIALLMGFPEEDWERLRRFSYVAIADQDLDIAGGWENHALERAHAEIFSYFAVQTSRCAAPGDDLITAIQNTRVGDRPLSREEILFNCYSLLLGATVTTAHAANVAVLALAEHPGQCRAWRDTRCTGQLMEEVLRWSSPANHFLRYAVRDVEIGGVAVSQGDPVTVWLGSANRDEDVFDSPYRFDVTRVPGQHIAFGVGAHRCIGAPLARAALSAFLEELLDCVQEFEITGPVTHLASNFIAGIKQLPVRLTLTEKARRQMAGLASLDRGGGR